MKKTIKELFITIGYTCLFNIFNWLVFILFNEIVFEPGAEGGFISGIIILIIGVIVYLVFEKKVIKKRGFNFKLFLISFILTWQVFWLVSPLIVDVHGITKNIFSHDCDNNYMKMLCGLEYALFWIGIQIQFVTIFLIKGIMWIYKKVKAKNDII